MKRVIEVLTDIATVCGSRGPFAWTEHEGKVFIAGLDYDTHTTLLHVYDVDELEEWETRALEFQTSSGEPWDICVFETDNRQHSF